MATVFTQIINGDIPGRFIWKDEKAVAFLTIEPMGEGHTLVVPREEIDHWIDLPADLNAHLFDVAQKIGQAQSHLFTATKIGLMIAGLEVPHTHLHVYPVNGLADFGPEAIDRNIDGATLDAHAEKLRAALREAGWEEFVPES